MTDDGPVPEPVTLCYHVPKTGGQSLRSALIDALGDRVVHLGPNAEGGAGREATAEWRGQAEVRVVVGHLVERRHGDGFGTRPVEEMTVVREPGAVQPLVGFGCVRVLRAGDAR